MVSHLGLLPQRFNQYGGVKVQGKSSSQKSDLIKLAKENEVAGASLLLVEGVKEGLARSIVSSVNIPFIGIGASPECDGQVLVTDDLLGIFSDFTPRFVKKYAHLSQEIEKAFKEFETEVRNGSFPTMDHSFE